MSTQDDKVGVAAERIAKTFAERRAELRLRQVDVGRLAGTGRYTVASIEKESPGKSVENLLAIAEALQMEITFKLRPVVHISMPEKEDR